MKVKELLTDESKWTKGSFARDVRGNKCSLKDDCAVCWCLEGALLQCYGDFHSHIMEEIRREIGEPMIYRWNDSHSFEDVKALVEKLDI